MGMGRPERTEKCQGGCRHAPSCMRRTAAELKEVRSRCRLLQEKLDEAVMEVVRAREEVMRVEF